MYDELEVTVSRLHVVARPVLNTSSMPKVYMLNQLHHLNIHVLPR